MSKKLVMMIASLLILVVLAACTSAGPAETPKPGAATPAAKTTKPVAGGNLRFGTYAEAATFDLMLTQQAAETRVAMSLYDPLISKNIETGALEPGLAESWTVAPDGLSITLKLRKGVKFHDGTPFNAEALKVNLERQALDPKSYVKTGASLNAITSVDVVDESTVKVNLNKQLGPILSYWSDIWGGQMSPAAIKKFGEDLGRNPVGTGPFKFVEWVKDDHLTVTKNPDYWRKDKDGAALPYLDGITFKPIPDDSVRLVNLRTNAIDLAEYIPGKDIQTVKGDSNLKYVERVSNGWENIVFSCTKPAPLTKREVRQALNYAVDKDAIIKLRFGLGAPARGMMSPTDPWFDQSIPEYKYDPEKAKQLLAQAGYPNGFELTADIPTQPMRVEAMEAIQAQLAKVGVKMNLKTWELATLISQVWIPGTSEATIIWWGGTADYDKYLSQFRRSDPRSKALGCATSEMSDLVDKGQTTYDPEQRKKLYQQFERSINQDADMLFLLHPVNNVAMNKKVQNYKIALPVLYYFNEVWMEK